MGNSTSKGQQLLLEASKQKCYLADGHLKFNGYHQQVADTIKTFVEKQTRSPSETQQYTVELPEDEDDEMENANEGGLNTRRQGNNYVTEAHQLPWYNNNVPERRDVNLELLPALKGVEKQFRNAYESGKDVSKKLETNCIENNSEVLQPLKLLRSLSRSSSRVHSSTFEEYEIMGSTLKMMEYWEEKLYKDLKKEKKAMKSDKSNANADEEHHTTVVNPKIKVSKESARICLKKITKLRDEQLLPRLIEQLDGMMENWKAMSEFFETQNNIMSQVKESPPLRCDDEHREATKALKKKFRDWCSFFDSYVSLQGAYIYVLYRWLSESSSAILVGDNHCDWEGFLNELKSYTKEVTSEMKKFLKSVEALLVQQRKEHYQKKEVERLEARVEIKEQMINDVNEKQTREEIVELKERIENNKEKHQSQMQETQLKVNQFQTGFCSLFEKLADFSRKAAYIYTELIKPLQICMNGNVLVLRQNE